MNRHDRRARNHGIRLAAVNGETRDTEPPRVEPEVAPVFAWCIHEERSEAPRFPIGARVKYIGPARLLEGAHAIVVASSQRLCRLMGFEDFKRLAEGIPGKRKPFNPDVLDSVHDVPAYYLDHIELADGRNRTHMPELAFPVWASEPWLEIAPRVVLG